MSKHTPGPWVARVHGGCWYVFAGNAMVADDGADETPCVARMRGVGRGATEEEQEANAYLIAAAPRVLQALRALASEVKLQLGPHPGVPALREAKEALAAADTEVR